MPTISTPLMHVTDNIPLLLRLYLSCTLPFCYSDQVLHRGSEVRRGEVYIYTFAASGGMHTGRQKKKRRACLA